VDAAPGSWERSRDRSVDWFRSNDSNRSAGEADHGERALREVDLPQGADEHGPAVRDLFVPGLQKLGFAVRLPKASFYVWIRLPKGKTSAGYASELIEKAGIVATPGNGFGDAGEGNVRMTMTAPEARLRLALERLAALR
jgi:aspartate/methionine/tyrosine aminotransferase